MEVRPESRDSTAVRGRVGSTTPPPTHDTRTPTSTDRYLPMPRRHQTAWGSRAPRSTTKSKPWRRALDAAARSARRPLREFLIEPCARSDRPQRASGFGRSWKWITLLVVPFPVSIWNGARLLTVAHRPRPFHPAFGSSIRPSSHFVKKPVGYGTRMTTHWPSLSASNASDSLPVLIGVF